jgi:hypothetical protein
VRLRRRKQDAGGKEFRVEIQHREVIAYWEGDRGFLFDAAWGAKPRTLFVPTEEAWDDVVPDWLRGRRDVVLQRLAAATKHRIEATDDPMREQELRPVSVDEARVIGTEWLGRIEAQSGPWTIEAFEETEAGWRLTYRLLEPERYAPARPDGRFAILVRRETGEIKIL